MSIHPKKAGRYEVRWREGSRNRGRTFDRKADAQDFEAHVRRQAQMGETVPTRMGSATLAQEFARWLATRHDLSPRTLRLYEELFETHVLDQLGYAPMRNIDHQRIERWQSERIAAGAGKEMVTKAAKLLSQLFMDALRQGKVNRNPLEGLRKPAKEPKEIIPATPTQVEAIRGWFLKRDRPGDATLVTVMAYGGLRVGEALGLKWEDFGDVSRAWISRSLEDDGTFIPTKNRINRLVEFPKPAADDLLLWRNATGPEGLVFPRVKDGKGWTKTDRNNWRRRWFAEAAKEAGWTEPPKNLRHSCASLRIAAGDRSTEVAEALGHSLAVSVRVYQRVMREMVGQPIRPVDEMILEARTQREQLNDKEAQETPNAESGRVEEIA